MTKANVVAALAALAQETRLDIFRLLVERGPEGMPAGEIGERLKLPSPTLSFHLNQLRHTRPRNFAPAEQADHLRRQVPHDE